MNDILHFFVLENLSAIKLMLGSFCTLLSEVYMSVLLFRALKAHAVVGVSKVDVNTTITGYGTSVTMQSGARYIASTIPRLAAVTIKPGNDRDIKL